MFQDKLPGLPPDRGVEHVIDSGDAEPVYRPPYKMSPLELDELRRQLKELVDLGLIRPSSSPWGALVLFIHKKDGSLRMCVDYRAANRLSRHNSTALPRIDECVERLSKATCFTSLDLRSGYHQVRYDPRTRTKPHSILDMGSSAGVFCRLACATRRQCFKR